MAISNLNPSPDEKLAQKLETNLALTTKSEVPSIKVANQSTNQSISQPINQSIDQSVNQSTNQLTGKVVERPVAFYIPEKIDQKIDEAVRYYQDKHNRKIDRSAVVSALLGNPEIWSSQSLDRLVDQVVNQLTNRLVSRLVA